jgi:hypothetical protein
MAAALAPFASSRARAALDSLRRAPRPTGAAAPIEKGGPRPLGVPRASNGLLAIGIIGAVVTVALLGLAAGIHIANRTAPAPSLPAEAGVRGR